MNIFFDIRLQHLKLLPNCNHSLNLFLLSPFRYILNLPHHSLIIFLYLPNPFLSLLPPLLSYPSLLLLLFDRLLPSLYPLLPLLYLHPRQSELPPQLPRLILHTLTLLSYLPDLFPQPLNLLLSHLGVLGILNQPFIGYCTVQSALNRLIRALG